MQTSTLQSAPQETNLSRGLMSLIYKEHLHINMKKVNNLMEMWAKNITLTTHWKGSTDTFNLTDTKSNTN